MIKIEYLFILIMMSSCYYKDGCFYAPQSVDCNIKRKSAFDSYQKSGVSDEEKIMDMKDCIGEYAEIIDYRKDLFGQLRKLPRLNVVREFSQCMLHRKGYMYDDSRI